MDGDSKPMRRLLTPTLTNAFKQGDSDDADHDVLFWAFASVFSRLEDMLNHGDQRYLRERKQRRLNRL